MNDRFVVWIGVTLGLIGCMSMYWTNTRSRMLIALIILAGFVASITGPWYR
jgi:hypothetical protein